MKHATFHRGFMWAALVAALGAGFPIGAHLTFVIGFGFPISLGYASFVQAHGHVQLLGWVGLLIMGISLHFIPRLAGVPIAQPARLSHIVWLMGTGLALRSLGHAIVPYLSAQPAYDAVAWILIGSGVLEGWAVGAYVSILVALLRGVGDTSARPALLSVRPYLIMMVCGWLLYTGLNLLLLVHMVLVHAVVLHPAWNLWAIQTFIGFVLLPVAFAFSLRMLPLYLRLPPIDGSAPVVAYVYLTALLCQLLPNLPPLVQQAPRLLLTLSHIGTLLKASVIVCFVWKLDVLTRLRAPWTRRRQLQPAPIRRPTRPGLPDYGEFGGFERLVYAAYIWLLLAAGAEAVSALALLLGWSVIISSNAMLHMYLMGFISHLIFAMAVRMLPGFMHQRRVASPALVTATFWLGNSAALGRVGLFVLPQDVQRIFPGIHVAARWAFAVSGLLALGAVWALAINLWKTSRCT